MFWVVHSCNIIFLFVPQIYVQHRNTLMHPICEARLEQCLNAFHDFYLHTWIVLMFFFFSSSSRPFYVEPRNIVDDDPQERVSAEAAILNSRVHYYSRLTGSSDRLLVSQLINQLHGTTLECLGWLKTPNLPLQVLCIIWIKFACGGERKKNKNLAEQVGNKHALVCFSVDFPPHCLSSGYL